jgi:hypothetical protein
MTGDEPQSEQQERLELKSEPRADDDPRPWVAHDPDYADETTGIPLGNQIAPPDGGELIDREATEIAEYAGMGPEVGQEQQALRVGTPTRVTDAETGPEHQDPEEPPD